MPPFSSPPLFAAAFFAIFFLFFDAITLMLRYAAIKLPFRHDADAFR